MIQNLPNEVWKLIDCFDNYQISNWGRVKRLKGYGCTKERLLKLAKVKGGYLQVKLCKDGISKIFLVHRLVAQHFIDNPNNLQEINHKSEDKTDNRVQNLEYCDRKYNNSYGTRNGRIAETLSKSVLQYSLDGTFIKEWQSTIEIKRQLGFGHISECCNGKYKQMYGFIWKYKNEE